ncbi:MAG: ABC transporter ATP-binding protein, partial [Micrococcales bacterium]
GRRGPMPGGKDKGPKASFKALFPYMGQHKKPLIIAVVLSLFGASVSLAQPLVVGQLINAVQSSKPTTLLAIALLGVVVASAASDGFMRYLLAKAGEGIVRTARNSLAGRLLRLPVVEYDLRRTGDLVSRTSSDTTLLRAVLTQGLVDLAGGALIFLGSTIAMLFIDPLLLLITVLMLSIAVASVAITSRTIRTATTKAQERVGEMSAAVERALSAVRTIRAARAESRETEQVNKAADEAYVQGVRIAKISSAISPIGGLAFNSAFIVVLGVGGYRVASGATTVASLVSFVLLMFLMMRPVGVAFGAISSVQSALGALARIQEILNLPVEENEGHEFAARKARNKTAIEFKKVSFGYAPTPATDDQPAGEAREVLKQVSFKIERGSRVALVGPSGAGKSTIFSLIERFYDPTSGDILLDGQKVSEISRESVRAQIGYVEQDAPVLAGSIRENLLIGRPAATDEELRAVLGEVNLIEVLDRDARGLDAEVGEKGIMLSGGERQRLAIARTLLAAPPILLLDESTSSLDGLNEQRLKDAIDTVAKNRTMFVIAHRLATVVDSDLIIVLQDGQVVGVGTHKELLKSTPLYKDLAKQQKLA